MGDDVVWAYVFDDGEVICVECILLVLSADLRGRKAKIPRVETDYRQLIDDFDGRDPGCGWCSEEIITKGASDTEAARLTRRIAGYTFKGGLWCSYRCMFGTARGLPTETLLDSRAVRLRVNRDDEGSYSSSEFPKVIYADQMPVTTRRVCKACLKRLK